MRTANALNASENVLAAAQKLGVISSKAEEDFLKEGCVSRTDTPPLSLSGSEEDSQDLEVESKGDHDVEPMEIVYTKEVGAIEPTSGIAYPAGLNQYKFLGCGIRTKYLVIHAYTVGVYLDADVKADDNPRDLLLDPEYPKVFRLVMNRNVTSSQYIGAIYDALTPLMKGQDMDKLEQMKTQELPKMLNKGTEIFLMVKGNKLTLQLGTDRAGEIESIVLTRALCENYVGDNPVSPAAKKAIWKGLEKLQQQAS